MILDILGGQENNTFDLIKSEGLNQTMQSMMVNIGQNIKLIQWNKANATYSNKQIY